MLIFLYIPTILYPWIHKTRKHYWIWCAMLLCIMVATAANLADISNYEIYFNQIGQSDSSIAQIELSIGWIFLCKIFYILGFTYHGMAVILVFIACLLLHKFFMCFSGKEALIWSLFLVFPAFTQITQIRFFLAVSIATYSMKFLLFDNTKVGLIKYEIGVLIGTLVHTGVLILAIYGCIVFFGKFKMWKAIMFTMAVSSAILFRKDIILRLASQFVGQMRFNRYFGVAAEVSTFSRIIQVIIVWLFGIIFSNYFYKWYSKRVRKQEEYDLKQLLALKKSNILVGITGITITFLFFDASFHRYFEVSYLLVYIMISIYFMYKKQTISKKVLFFVTFSGSLFYLTRFYITMDTMVLPLMRVERIYPLVRWFTR